MDNSYRELYDKSYFDRLHQLDSIGSNTYRESQRLETIELLCKPGITDDVLELGCGTGFYTGLLAPRVHKIVGVDFSPTAIEMAISQFQRDNVEFLVASIEKLDMLSDNSFGKILAIDVLEHLSEIQLEASLREVARLLKHNGVFVFFTPCRSHWIERLKAKNIILKQFREHIGVLTEREYYQITQALGLEVRHVLRYETCIPVWRVFERILKRIPGIGNIFVSRLGIAVYKKICSV